MSAVALFLHSFPLKCIQISNAIIHERPASVLTGRNAQLQNKFASMSHSKFPTTCNLESLLELSWLTLSHLVVRSSSWDFRLVISSSDVSRRSFALFLTEATCWPGGKRDKIKIYSRRLKCVRLSDLLVERVVVFRCWLEGVAKPLTFPQWKRTDSCYHTDESPNHVVGAMQGYREVNETCSVTLQLGEIKIKQPLRL